MGFFTKKKIIVEEPNESTLKEESETEVETLQNEFKVKQEEITKITEKIQTVKEEYDTTVSNLMLIKKEFNQKKMELDVIQREYREIREKIKNSQQIKDTKTINEFNKTETEFKKIKEELDKMKKEHSQIKEEIVKGESSLHGIRKQQVEVGKELDEANSRLYNAKQELDRKDQFQDTSILTPKEKKDIKGDNSNGKTNASVIEAASIVVGSLKSKLTKAENELEQMQKLLEEERESHRKTRQELIKIQSSKN
ncbi:MAG: DNA repair protein [Candidatus Nitrosopumilus limneticus]|nr:DNA repair protein [Candidatus Nitrosopumilus limneticus]MDC4212610.1 DNA repair protein [Candidatus Nitrosopumilus limneticus]MDC4213121.1 DNA repair protein [Candidatus Nitrosopumilus limneticus]MDC4214238.1 DNA repair protein [Candidatus Nitrosopumilus limneticus]MDC4215960.1 DNA repair protein [Candidatus Nitrosopumilus limneticus]